MPRLPRLALAIVAFAGLQVAQADCRYPADVSIPDGDSATKEQMTAAGRAVKEYNVAVESYLACLDDEQKALGDAVTDEQKKMYTSRYNAAVDALNAVVGHYNEEVRAFKKKLEPSGG